MTLSILEFEVDVLLELTKYLDLYTAVCLSQTCLTFHQLSLSLLSFWIYATDVYHLPVTLSDIIKSKISAENLRYMALVVSVHRKNRGRQNASALIATRIELRGQGGGLRRLVGDPLFPHWVGPTSMFIQGYKSGSLPWLVTVRGNIVRCDCLDRAYDNGVEWDAKTPFDVEWLWRCDIAYSSGDEHVVVTLTTNAFGRDLNGMGGISTTDFYVVKISLPLKEQLESSNDVVEKRKIRLPRFHFQNHNPQGQPLLKVTHEHVPLPTGFVNHYCQPTSCGSRVFFMLNHKKSHSFWAFIYDWEDDTGVSFKIPMEARSRSNIQKIAGWKTIFGFNSTVVLQGWHGPLYAIRIPELHSLSRLQENPWFQLNIDQELLQVVQFEDNITEAEWDPQDDLDSAGTMEIVCNLFQASETAIYSISQLGTRVCCSLYKLTESGNHEGAQFTRVAGGFIDIPIGWGDQDLYLAFRAGGGASSVAATLKHLPSRYGWKTSPSFLAIDFEIDCGYDGADGIRHIKGSSRELNVESHTRNMWGRSKGSDFVLERPNIGTMFFDGFRGTVVVLSKDHKEAHIFSYARS